MAANRETRSFLWVTSMLGDLRDTDDEDSIEEKLSKVPTSMINKYVQDLKAVTKNKRPDMQLILIWLLSQLRDAPMSPEEIAAAIGRSKDFVSEICAGGLVTISTRPILTSKGMQEREVIDFVHFSAKEYLEAELLEPPQKGQSPKDSPHLAVPEDMGKTLSRSPSQESIPQQDAEVAEYRFSAESAHRKILGRCLEVLSLDAGQPQGAEGTNSQEEPATRSPLLDYAANYWVRHYQKINKTDDVPNDCVPELGNPIEMAKKLFVPHSPEFSSWLGVSNPDRQFVLSEIDRDTDRGEEPYGDPIYYAVSLGLDDIAMALIQERAPRDAPGREGTALQLALYKRNVKVARALIENAASIQDTGGPHGSPLYIACVRGFEDIVRMLLEEGAKTEGEQGKFGSPLHGAAYYNEGPVIELLINKGKANVDQLGGPFNTALQTAIAAGKGMAAKRLLLQHKADPGIVGGIFETALQAALVSDVLMRSPIASAMRRIERLFFKSEPRGLESNRLEIISLLKTKGVEYLEFTRTDWTPAWHQAIKLYGPFCREYYALFERQLRLQPRLRLTGTQRLLAAAVRGWRLPAASSIRNCMGILRSMCACKIPFEVQLEQIDAAICDYRPNNRDLDCQDFLGKALFWCGINYLAEASLSTPMINRRGGFERR